jgi:class 3 adenylate cyclase
LAIHVQLLCDQAIVRETTIDNLIEIGRDDLSHSVPDAPPRMSIASVEYTTIPRRWFMIHAVDDDQIRIDNIHVKREVKISLPDCRIPPGGSKSLALTYPVEVFLFENYRLRILTKAEAQRERPESSAAGPANLGDANQPLAPVFPRPPGDWDAETSSREQSTGVLVMRPLAGEHDHFSPIEVVHLFRKAVRVVTEAAASGAYLDLAIRTARELVRLDRVVLLVPQKPEDWHSNAGQAKTVEVFSSMSLHFSDVQSGLAAAADGGSAFQFEDSAVLSKSKVDWSPRGEDLAQGLAGPLPAIRYSVLNRVWELKTTQIHVSGRSSAQTDTRACQHILATPVIDRHGRVAAVLYGDRWTNTEHEQPISELDGLLFEVFAAAVSGGMARQSAERSQANLSEFFSPRVATMLSKRPEMLVGRDAEVSVLFCDVRGFSGISERCGAERTIALINDVLSDLSQCVVDEDGVLVDYVGDELFAMWGAPEPQFDHAARAIRAARQMLVTIQRLRDRWRDELQLDLDVGIGINSGPARVGNVGSRLKFKYGVLGNTVNLGSRLQGACKQLGVRCVVSSLSVMGMADRRHLRRLARLRVVGISQPVEVYEFVAELEPKWEQLRDEYEAALKDYESGRPGETVRRLGPLLQQNPGDRVSARLLGMAARQLTERTDVPQDVWELDVK